MQRAVNISQKEIIEKIKLYQSVHQYSKEDSGICYALSALLLAYIHEVMDEFYKQYKNTEKENIAILHQKIKEVVNKFYTSLESIAGSEKVTPDYFSIHKSQIDLRNTSNWYDANAKLQQAIDNKTLILKHIDISLPHYPAILNLAEEQNILSEQELTILKNAYIPEIPEYESFINNIQGLQFNYTYLFDVHKNFPRLFELLKKDNSISSPIREAGASFNLTPEEFASNFTNIFPENKLIFLSLPRHATAFIRIGNEYLFFNSNVPVRVPFAEGPEFMICMLTQHSMYAFLSHLQKDVNKNRKAIDSLLKLIPELNSFLQIVMEEKDAVKRSFLLENNRHLILPILGFSITIFTHANDPYPLPKNWEAFWMPMDKNNLDRRDICGETIFLKACADGNLKMVERILELGHSPDDKGTMLGATAFCMAGTGNHFDILKLLKQKGVSVDTPDVDGKTTLINTIRVGGHEVVEWLLTNGADVNLGKRKSQLFTPLYYACQSGHAGIVQLLSDHQAAPSRGGLHEAIKYNYGNVVQVLAKNNYDLHSSLADGLTPLMIAAKNKSHAVISVLLSENVNVNTVSANGETAAYFAIYNGDMFSLKLLLKHQAKLDFIYKGNNALYIACSELRTSMVEFLLHQMKFDVNKMNANGYAPLIRMSITGHLEILQLLLKHPDIFVNLQCAKDGGNTALHFAVMGSKTDVIRMLCEAGADMYAENDDKQTPYQQAVNLGFKEIVKLFLEIEKNNLQRVLINYIKQKNDLHKNNNTPRLFSENDSVKKNQVKINAAKKILVALNVNSTVSISLDEDNIIKKGSLKNIWQRFSLVIKESGASSRMKIQISSPLKLRNFNQYQSW